MLIILLIVLITFQDNVPADRILKNSVFNRLLSDASVRSELEFTDDQSNQLDELQAEFETKTREFLKAFDPNVNAAERQKLYKENIEFTRTFNQALDDFLLPHQKRRVRQIVNRYEWTQGSWTPLANPAVIHHLDVEPSQAKKMLDRGAELKSEIDKRAKEMVEELRKMHLDAEKELTNLLDDQQKQEYRELTGDPIELEEREFGRFPSGKK